MRLDIRNEFLGPIPPCSIEVKPLTVLTGGESAGTGLLLRTIFFLSSLRWLLQVLWEREADDGSSVLEQPKPVQNHLATLGFMEIMAGQNVDLRPGSVLRWGGTEVVLGAPLTIRSLENAPPSLFFSKERILAETLKSPMARASLGLLFEILHNSQVQLEHATLQVRLVEFPELACTPFQQQAQVLRLAEWANEGHFVLLGTQEPRILQVINNLLLASLLPPREIRGMPRPGQRLGFARVAGYYLEAEKMPQPIMTEGQLQEESDPTGRLLQEQRQRLHLWINTLSEEHSRSAER